MFHVMNRGARRLTLFDGPDDYVTFMEVLSEAQGRMPLRLLSYALMPNHWHLLLWPERDEQLSCFMMWLTGTHSRRWHHARPSSGGGTIYQGRYKAVPVHDDYHFLVACRYIERNPLKARLAERSSEWPWSSASAGAESWRPVLGRWPVPKPSGWREVVDAVPLCGEFDELRAAIRTGRPFGPAAWQSDTSTRIGWTTGMPRGRHPRRRERAQEESEASEEVGGAGLNSSPSTAIQPGTGAPPGAPPTTHRGRRGPGVAHTA